MPERSSAEPARTTRSERSTAFHSFPSRISRIAGAAAAEGDRFASFAFYAKEVMKADGDIHMYATENDPKERVTIVGFDKRFVALPIRGKGIGAIVSASV